VAKHIEQPEPPAVELEDDRLDVEKQYCYKLHAYRAHQENEGIFTCHGNIEFFLFEKKYYSEEQTVCKEG